MSTDLNTEEVNEPVHVLASFRHASRGGSLAKPEVMEWRGRRYRITDTGLRWPTSKGRRMLHRFTFSHNGSCFELEFDAEALTWQLLRLSTEA